MRNGENGTQLRSHVAQRLNVPNDVRLTSLLAPALPDTILTILWSEHEAKLST